MENIFAKFNFREEAISDLKKAYDAIKNSSATEILNDRLKKYSLSDTVNITELTNDINRIKELSGVNEYTATFIFYLLATDHLEELYKKNGLDKGMLTGALKDLEYKLNECFETRGIWGTQSREWHGMFFEMKVLSLGRLQYEPNVWDERLGDYNGACTLNVGERIVYAHIPSSGKLLTEDCIDSFKRAYDFFPQIRKDGVLPIACRSWLLEPAFREILPPSSNIRKFNELFDIVKVDEYDRFHDAWRVFYGDAALPPEEWREDTSLRRILKKFTLEGNVVRAATGILFFDGKNRIK